MLLHSGVWPLVCGLGADFGCGLGRDEEDGAVEGLLYKYEYGLHGALRGVAGYLRAYTYIYI